MLGGWFPLFIRGLGSWNAVSPWFFVGELAGEAALCVVAPVQCECGYGPVLFVSRVHTVCVVPGALGVSWAQTGSAAGFPGRFEVAAPVVWDMEGESIFAKRVFVGGTTRARAGIAFGVRCPLSSPV